MNHPQISRQILYEVKDTVKTFCELCNRELNVLAFGYVICSECAKKARTGLLITPINKANVKVTNKK